MQKVLTAEQMREVDRLTIERYGNPSIQLMENAAHAVVRVITEKLGGSVDGKSIAILCGPGNNGGDGAAIGRLLHADGARVEVNLFGRIEQTKGDARTNFEKIASMASRDFHNKGSLYFEETLHMDNWVHSTGHTIGGFDVFVDALFGTGLTRPLDSTFRNLPLVVGMQLNDVDDRLEDASEPALILSVDIPSGLNSDSANATDPHVRADVTVTFTSPKTGNILPPASRENGELIVADIGSPQDLIDEQASKLFLAEKKDAVLWLERSAFTDSSFKNKRGHALLIAGSESYSGAAVLAGNAAMRSGVGLVTVAAPKECKAEVASRLLPDVILTDIREAEASELLSKPDAIAVGCGLSATDQSIEAMVRKIVAERTVPVIIDAGALWFYSPFKMQTPARELPPLILTPHEGEFMRLLGTGDKEVIKDRVAAVREFATRNNVILVLKGERALIGEPGGKVVVNPTGNSGLGKAGNADTLTGTLAGFVAQAVQFNIDIFETVVTAVYIAGMAGDVAETKYGMRVMTASDVRECLVDVFALFAEENK